MSLSEQYVNRSSSLSVRLVATRVDSSSFCFAICVCLSACDSVRALCLRPKIDTQRLQNRPQNRPLEGPKSTSEHHGRSRSSQRPLRTVQEPPKSAPRAPKIAQEPPKSAPREPQERPKSVPERLRMSQEPQKLPQIAASRPQSLKIS